MFGILLIISMTVTDIYEAMNSKAEAFFEWLQAHPKYGLLFGVGLLALWLAGLLFRWKWACVWYVAEIWHERERTNLNGRMLLFWCWLFVLLIPLGVPPILRLFGWMIGLAIVIPLCFLPDLFCKLRYTAGRREALREHYGKMKHPGRKLAKIVLIVIALTVANFPLMFHFGFIHWA